MPDFSQLNFSRSGNYAFRQFAQKFPRRKRTTKGPMASNCLSKKSRKFEISASHWLAVGKEKAL
jgi:hypothetical protein